MLDAQPFTRRDPRVDRAITVILARYREPRTLERVARESGLSASHFHRLFHAQTGETLARFVERVRLFRGANMLVSTQSSVIDIALELGFRNHETFTRAFTRRYGRSPQRYRQERCLPDRGQPRWHQTDDRTGSWSIAPARVIHTPIQFIATLRHTGAYETVPVSLWQRLDRALTEQAVPTGVYLGIGWDAPGTTAVESLRFDAGVLLAIDIDLPSPTRVIPFPATTWISTIYSGSFANLSAAYPSIVAQAMALPDSSLIEGPVMELYYTHDMRTGRSFTQIEVLLPAEIT